MSEPLADKVISAIAEVSRKPVEEVRLESTFADLGIDSLNGFDLLCRLEEDLGIVIPDDVARELRSVGDVVDKIRPLVEARPS
jgi:NADH dehydrogenase (ubiquinone) 1 alpha/beta subcomplex 1